MTPDVTPELTLWMILLSGILDLITGISDPSLYYPHSWQFVPPHAK